MGECLGGPFTGRRPCDRSKAWPAIGVINPLPKLLKVCELQPGAAEMKAFEVSER